MHEYTDITKDFFDLIWRAKDGSTGQNNKINTSVEAYLKNVWSVRGEEQRKNFNWKRWDNVNPNKRRRNQYEGYPIATRPHVNVADFYMMWRYLEFALHNQNQGLIRACSDIVRHM